MSAAPTVVPCCANMRAMVFTVGSMETMASRVVYYKRPTPEKDTKPRRAARHTLPSKADLKPRIARVIMMTVAHCRRAQPNACMPYAEGKKLTFALQHRYKYMEQQRHLQRLLACTIGKLELLLAATPPFYRNSTRRVQPDRPSLSSGEETRPSSPELQDSAMQEIIHKTSL